VKIAYALVAALLAGAAAAQDTPTVESLSEIRDFELASLDTTSIESRGEVTRFDVRVKWRDPEQRPPNAPASRIIRYVAKCGEKTLGAVAVAAIDQNGKMLKSFVTPPGATDFLPAKEGSREAGWLGQACR
jgi:hypothetical protein